VIAISCHSRFGHHDEQPSLLEEFLPILLDYRRGEGNRIRGDQVVVLFHHLIECTKGVV
jgi:hypothetical protein